MTHEEFTAYGTLTVNYRTLLDTHKDQEYQLRQVAVRAGVSVPASSEKEPRQ